MTKEKDTPIPKKAADAILATAKEEKEESVENMSIRQKVTYTLLIVAALIAMGAFTAEYIGTTRLKADIKDVKGKLEICQKNLSNFNNVKEREVTAIVSYIHTYHKRISTTVAQEIARKATELSEKHGLALPLIIGIMEVESAFNPTAVSDKGARGLMQVIHKVWKAKLAEVLQIKSRFELHEIDKGIESGMIVLSIYLEQSDQDISEALYLYVGKDKAYATKVYEKMGRFVLYKASISMPTPELEEVELPTPEEVETTTPEVETEPEVKTSE